MPSLTDAALFQSSRLTAYCLVKLAVPPSVYACSLPPLTAVVQ